MNDVDAELCRLRARLEAWEPIVRIACTLLSGVHRGPVTGEDRDAVAASLLETAVNQMPKEHRL